MTFVFWSSLSLVCTTYLGYPIWVYLRARLRPQAVRRESIFPSVTIILAVHNEEKNLPRKLHNLAALDYPPDCVETVIVSDGSSDGTNSILANWQDANRRMVFFQKRAGKAVAVNNGVAVARGEIICFTDVRQIIASDALKNLVVSFADDSIGCVSGELMIAEDEKAASANGVGLYWQLEKNLRKWEGLSGSTVGATGAFYAVRKDLVVPMPAGTILDDVYIPLQVARQGQRVVFEHQALIWDHLVPSPRQEFRRKVRTLVGNYQLLKIAPWVVTNSNPLYLRFICHKLLRLLVPFGLVGIVISTLWIRSGIYELALMAQLAFYAMAALRIFGAKLGVLSRLSNISVAFIVLNLAAAVAPFYFVTNVGFRRGTR